VSALAWAGVAALGGVGAVLRFLLDGAVSGRWGGRLPWGTLAVNLTGALALGVLAGSGIAGDAQLLSETALLGSYTTFSTWMLEADRLAEDGNGAAALVNIVLSLALGLAAVAVGRALA
jgi:CrcB protein